MFRRVAYLSLVALLSLAGCNPPEPSNDGEVKLKFYTWWSVGGERDALDALAAKNRERHPNVSLLSYTTETAEDTFSALSALLTYGKQPELFQTNGGSRLFSHVVSMRVTPSVSLLGGTQKQVEENKDSRLKPLDDLYERSQSKIWKILESAVSVDGVRYGVPLNVHRINNLYYSVSKLKQHQKVPSAEQIVLPSDLESFISLASELTKANGGNGAIGIGIRDTWTLEALVFENLLPSVAMSEQAWQMAGQSSTEDERRGFFEDFWKGARNPQSEPDFTIVDETLKRAQELWGYVQTYGEPDGKSEFGQWQDPFNDLFAEGSGVAFVVMGDWATGYLDGLGKEQQLDYGVVPFPGTEKLFIYATDTIPVTERAEHAEEAKDFLETALDVDAQIAFNRKKGSVPAVELTEKQIDALKPHQKRAVDALRDTSVRKSMAMSGLVTPALPSNLIRDSLVSMLTAAAPWEGRDVVHSFFKNHYWMLQDWTKCLGDKGTCSSSL